jgi:hypothetical protein
MPYALIEPSGRIAEIASEPFPVAAPLQWVEVADEVTTAWRYENGAALAPELEPEFEPEQPSLEERIAALEAALIAKGMLTQAEIADRAPKASR